MPKVRHPFLFALAFTIICAAVAVLLGGCDDGPEAPPPPIGEGSGPVLPVVPDVPPEVEPEPLCPWDGTCAALLTCDGLCGPGECDLPCGDGVRCVDTEKEGGILCDIDGSSGSSSSTGGESSSDGGITSFAG